MLLEKWGCSRLSCLMTSQNGSNTCSVLSSVLACFRLLSTNCFQLQLSHTAAKTTNAQPVSSKRELKEIILLFFSVWKMAVLWVMMWFAWCIQSWAVVQWVSGWWWAGQCGCSCVCSSGKSISHNWGKSLEPLNTCCIWCYLNAYSVS